MITAMIPQNNTLIQNEVALEILTTQRNTLLQPMSCFLIQSINFDDNNSHTLLGITVFQDCIEVMNFGTLPTELEFANNEQIIKFFEGKTVTQIPSYLNNPFCSGFEPNVGQEYFPNEVGMVFHRSLFMATPPFNRYTLLV